MKFSMAGQEKGWPLNTGDYMVLIVWYMDLQLPMQSVPITTGVVSLNLDQGEVYNSMW